MAYVLSFTLPGLPRMQNPSGRPTHWAVLSKEKKHWHDMIALMVTVLKRPPAPLKRAKVTIVRCSSVCPDYDGMVSGGKRILDGLVKAGVLENDKQDNIGAPIYLWEKAPPKKGSMKVKIEEVCDNVLGETQGQGSQDHGRLPPSLI